MEPCTADGITHCDCDQCEARLEREEAEMAKLYAKEKAKPVVVCEECGGTDHADSPSCTECCEHPDADHRECPDCGSDEPFWRAVRLAESIAEGDR